MHIRQGIFSVRQETWYQDADDCDKNSIHFLGTFKNKDLAAYLRAIEPGIKHEEASIGRVSILKEYRRKGLGKDLLKKAVEKCLSFYPTNGIKLSAQLYLENFYFQKGFIREILSKKIDSLILK